MIFPYVPRLLCLCLALFFFVHLITGMAVWFATPGAIWMAGRMRARSAARFLLALRLLPCAVALFAVAAFCLPSYLSLEPEATTERVGLICLAAALLATASWARSVFRAWRGVANSMKYVRQCRGSGHEVYLIGAPSPVWVLEAASPLLALVGVIHSRIVISRAVMGALSPEELAAALRHEHAHGLSRDNLKRLAATADAGYSPVRASVSTNRARMGEIHGMGGGRCSRGGRFAQVALSRGNTGSGGADVRSCRSCAAAAYFAGGESLGRTGARRSPAQRRFILEELTVGHGSDRECRTDVHVCSDRTDVRVRNTSFRAFAARTLDPLNLAIQFHGFNRIPSNYDLW